MRVKCHHRGWRWLNVHGLMMGRESAFLRAEHDVGGLDPGQRKVRLWIDGWGKTPWRTVEVECPPFKVIRRG